MTRMAYEAEIDRLQRLYDKVQSDEEIVGGDSELEEDILEESEQANMIRTQSSQILIRIIVGMMIHTTMYLRKLLTLNELLREIEDIDDIADIPDEIVIFPPENANDCITDEDSGDENDVVLNNLPGCQLRANAEVRIDRNQEDVMANPDEVNQESESEDDLPLSTFVKKKLKHPNNITIR
ncbi:hypothetical protein RN001_009164 [Aquatica leii]|uniref:Uncharacterized protein n=1 Tax=Aquatica leii TaxID=1421715 RepID=A0AAN7SMT0_9COLE|nr:hypothetical protein RN001_009164 [Aquatica leii]